MKQALYLVGFVAAGFTGLDIAFGYEAAYAISYGAIALMAVAISLTFLWLYVQRTTPLALGMSFSWAGAASVMGWWWLYNAFDRPGAMDESGVLFLFVALYFVGAIMHFAVILKSLDLPRPLFVLPILASLLLSAAIHLAG